jgi:two-component system cell cycle sensor histidine kinase/response regulator CckA
MKPKKAPKPFARRPMDDARLAMARLSPSRIELEEIYRRICRIAADTLAVERVGIWLFVHSQTALQCCVLFERTRGECSSGATLQVGDFPAYFESVRSRKTIPAESALDDPRTNELRETYLVPLGIEAMLDAPILLDGEVAGVVCHEHVGGAREWTTEERDFAGSVADTVALKLKSADAGQAQQLRQLSTEHRAMFRERDSVAQLAAGVAHDFRNLITVIIGNAEVARIAAEQSPEVDRAANAILDAARRGSAMATQLMELARNEAGHPRVVDPADVLSRAMPVLKEAAGALHPVEYSQGEPVGRVFADPSQIDRVLLNLVVNARDAMPRGGAVRIRLCEAAAKSPGNAGPCPMVAIEVRDTGRGIDPALIGRIFDPFFSTKMRHEGSGLGLAIVRHIVELAGGTIEVESQVGHGSMFRVMLPRVAH